MTFRLAIIDSHPIQYKAPMYRILPEFNIDAKVFYCDHFGNDDSVDPDFGVSIKWDVDLLSGYDHTFLNNRSLWPSPYSFKGIINPGIWSAIRKGHFDAVLVSGYSRVSDHIALMSARLLRTPVVFKGEADNLRPSSFKKRLMKKAIVQRILKQPQAILYSCNANKEYFQSYGVPDQKLIFCPSAVDNHYFQNEYDKYFGLRKELRESMGIPDDAKVILYTGRLTDRKRPIDLLKALVLLHSNSPVWTIFVGDGPERQAVEDFAHNNDIDNVIITGFVNQSQIAKYYSVADVFTLLSEHDPSPKSLHEALNFRLPVVVSNRVGTAKDLVQDGENGYVFEFRNVVNLANRLERCLNSGNTHVAMGERSRELVSGWTFEAQAKAIFNAITMTKSRTKKQ